ncbi:alpha-glucosidase [Lentzea sp. NBRC 105346]|uniref:glycoside hydrolase family 13 protein n=1 Tax=Lentzea sp. NBRC 105346 TaxID=3032205 RepID=UPI0024A57E8C|nr:glycoside hydrolase family 13 protein [Lentzea sp. NBRC 105346]GLZ31098.1 alpha-glucosidase [Lentzea sp. NBRC 105346]
MEWWRNAAIYQVYPRSFADGNGDGIGDLTGLRTRLPHIANLGVDAIWLCPWYPSPWKDGGYDVSDYRDIDPLFGTLAEAEKLIGEAHDLGLRVIIDIVPNHCSDQHPWFRNDLRGRFHFRQSETPPNDWRSRFGGSAWTQLEPGAWYLHLYAAEQPDLNWDNPVVRQEFRDILRFWLDRGVDGFRIDVADGLVKDFTKPDADAPYSDQDSVHEIYRDWRRIADEYDDRVLVGEMWLPDPERFARYLRPDELHTAFNFDFLCCPWDATAFRQVIDATIAAHAPVDAPPTWVLSNHDVTRHVTRYGRENTGFSFADRQHGVPTDRAKGVRRARAAIMLAAALPGGLYVYQGEELGLWEVEDLPDELREDPVWHRSGFTDRGRDGCRVPIPWGDNEKTWLPQPSEWQALSVAAQTGESESMLSHYQRVLQHRKELTGDLTWLELGEDVLAFRRDEFTCVVNFSSRAISLPGTAFLTSTEVEGGQLPPDAAAWIN